MKKFNLDCYISVEKGEIIFNLDTEIMEKITHNFIHISPALLTNLRWYFLNQKQQDSPLIFVSYYQEDPIIKTVIDNHITNQVYSHYLPKTELLKKINFTHHCLVEYVLRKIRISGILNINLSLIAGIFSGIIVILTLGLNFAKFMSLNPLFVLLPLLMWWLLQEGFKRIMVLFLPKFNRIIWRYLLLNKDIVSEKIIKFILTNLNS